MHHLHDNYTNMSNVHLYLLQSNISMHAVLYTQIKICIAIYS